MIGIKRKLIVNPKANQYSYGHSHTKATDIDNRRNLVLNYVSPGDFEIISRHG
jgi:hypothetical protein